MNTDSERQSDSGSGATPGSIQHCISRRSTKWTIAGTMGMLQDENATQVNDITFVDDQGNPANKVSVELLLKVAEWTAKKNPQQPHASEPPLLARGLVGLDVYAYGVKPLYGGPNGEHFQELPEGKILVWKPHGFLHYWIDEKLNYHECVKETGELAGVQWITQSKFKVELHGPNHYTVKLS